MINQGLLDAIADLEAIVEDAATYAKNIDVNQSAYELLRDGLTKDPNLTAILPEFLVRHKALGQVRRHYQKISAHYAERRQKIRDDLDPLYQVATGRGVQSLQPQRGLNATQPPGAAEPRADFTTAVTPPVRRDIFLSHATEDKAYARELVSALESYGYQVWFDEYEFLVGDSLSNSISRGLDHAAYGVVLISVAFLGKKWTDAELRAMYSKAMGIGDISILPVRYNLTHEQLATNYPLLADLFSLDGAGGAASVAEAIHKRIERDRKRNRGPL